MEAKKILAGLKKLPAADPFLYPVDWKGLGLRDYPTVVKQPMDLQTMTSKLGSYTSIDEFFADLRLIVSNCKKYNAEGSEVFEMATAFEIEIDRAFSQLWKDDAKKILQTLEKNKNSFLFLEPVDWKTLGLTDYLSIVKRPMDLGTVSAKLAQDQYSGINNFFDDIYLVWSNCMLYNADGSDVYKMALAMRNESDKLKAQVAQAAPVVVPATKRKASAVAEPPSSDPPDDGGVTDDVIRLAKRLSQLQTDYLTSAIRFIYAKCPDSIKAAEAGTLDIDVEMIAKDDSCSDSVNQLVKVLLFLQTNPDP
jgi:hypothetical protein